MTSGVSRGVSGVSKGISGISGVAGSLTGSKEKVPPTPEKLETPTELVKSAPEKPKVRKLNQKLATFEWEKVGYFHEPHSSKQDGAAMLAKSEAMETYLSDAYYLDFYTNTILAIGTCFFGWLVGRLANSVLWLMIVFFGAASVYRAEFRRFVRDSRDDMLRLSILDRLEQESETLEWCNNLLLKVWIVYMPLMGSIVKTNVNPILAGVAPGGGIDSIELSHFHLGLVAPKVTAIKSYTKIGNDAYEMDWEFAFDPNNRENMTKAEVRSQIMPKVVIKAAIGKGIISKKFPINVEDMGFVGKMKVRLTFTEKFPMIELIRVQFLEPPKIDYALKPIGGDTFGIDIMKFIPFLKTTINELVNYAIKSMLIAPNYQEVNLVDIMSAALTDISLVLAVNIHDASFSSSGDYYMVVAPENAAEDKKIKTESKSGKTPAWNTVYYVLNNLIEQLLLFNVYKIGGFGRDKLVGTAEFDLRECYQKESFHGVLAKIESSGKKIGFVNFDLNYFPELQAPELDDGTKGPVPESEVGILKFVLNHAVGLDLSSSMVGQLSPYALVYVNGTLKHKTRVLKRTNEPSFGDIIELLVGLKTETNIKVIIKDSVGFAEDTLLGEFEGSLEDILIQAKTNPFFKLTPAGALKVTPTWRPVAMTEIALEVSHRDALGVLKIHLRDAADLKNLELTGKVDPYVQVTLNGKVKYETIIHPETLDPVFEECVYVPVTLENQVIGLEVFDAEKSGHDRSLGSTSFKSGDFMGSVSHLLTKSKLQLPKGGGEKGELSYSVSFIPVTPVYSPKELKNLSEEDEKISKQMEKEKEEQEKLEKEYKKNPLAYEYYDAPSPFAHRDPNKKKMSLEQLVQSQGGVLSVEVIKGTLGHKNSYLDILLDELAYPSFVVGPASSLLIPSAFGQIFVRDLKNLILVLRECRFEDAAEPSDVYTEKQFLTLEILQKAYEEPATFSFGQNTVQIQVSFLPVSQPLDSSDLMEDTGVITVDILNAEDLRSADSNGKLDPYVEVMLNGAKVFKTECVKRTLLPTFNELATFPLPSLSRTRLELHAWDWDFASDNDILGTGRVDLLGVKPDIPKDISVPLTYEGKSAGVVHLRVLFESKYVRPEIQKFGGGGLPGIGTVTKAPVKLVGGAAKGAIGGVGFIAGGVGKGGGRLLGAFSSKKKRLLSSNAGNLDAQSSINGDSSLGAVGLNSNTHNGSLAVGNESSRLSTISTNKFGGARSAGRVTVKQLKTEADAHEHLLMKVLLQNKELGRKEILKTRKTKLHEGVYEFEEEATFKAIAEDELVFEAFVPHRLGKDVLIGEGSVGVSVGSEDVAVTIKGVGELIANVRFN